MDDQNLKKISQLMDDKLKTFGHQLTTDLADFMEKNLFPLVEEKADKNDIDRLERKIDNMSSRVADQDFRLKKVELTPTVAHELKK